MHSVSAPCSNQRFSVWTPGPLISSQVLVGILRYLCLGIQGVNVFVRLGGGVVSEAPVSQEPAVPSFSVPTATSGAESHLPTQLAKCQRGKTASR